MMGDAVKKFRWRSKIIETTPKSTTVWKERCPNDWRPFNSIDIVAGGSRRFHPFVAEFGKHDGRRMELVASAKVAAQVLEPGTSSLRLTLNRLSYAAFGKPPHVNRYGGTRKYEQHGSNRCGWSQRPGISTMVVTRDNDGSRLWIRQRSTDTLSIAKVGSVSAFHATETAEPALAR